MKSYQLFRGLRSADFPKLGRWFRELRGADFPKQIIKFILDDAQDKSWTPKKIIRHHSALIQSLVPLPID
jgi:hypothetical protein